MSETAFLLALWNPAMLPPPGFLAVVVCTEMAGLQGFVPSSQALVVDA